MKITTVLTLKIVSFFFIGSNMSVNAKTDDHQPLSTVSSENREEQLKEYRERLKGHESDIAESQGIAISPEGLSPKMQQAPKASGS